MTDLLGVRVKIFYDDGSGIMVRLGVVSGLDQDFIILENSVLIPRDRIVRIEVLR